MEACIIRSDLLLLGTQFYLIRYHTGKTCLVLRKYQSFKIRDFEDLSSPGIPSACYARPGGDRGATYFLDSREYYYGSHSVRLITPTEGKSVALRFFPFKVKAGASYAISIWAKS